MEPPTSAAAAITPPSASTRRLRWRFDMPISVINPNCLLRAFRKHPCEYDTKPSAKTATIPEASMVSSPSVLAMLMLLICGWNASALNRKNTVTENRQFAKCSA